jgi:hypothetical protein
MPVCGRNALTRVPGATLLAAGPPATVARLQGSPVVQTSLR